MGEYYNGEKPKLEEGKKFVDMSFEHDNDDSIFGKNQEWNEEEIKKFKKIHGYDMNEKIKWTRIFENEIIPYNEDTNNELIQGALVDCSIIAFIHCLKHELKEEFFFQLLVIVNQ